MPKNNFDDNLEEKLERNIGRVVTIFTESGGCTGRGFTGLLVKVNCDFVKLITELPSGPSNPFGTNLLGTNEFAGKCSNKSKSSNFGTVIIIPIDKIVAFVFNEI